MVFGKEILLYCLERLFEITHPDTIILATTSRSIDNPLCDFAERNRINFFRGSLNNVTGRVLKCAKENKLDHIVRVNGDSPLLDFALLKQAINYYESGQFDLVTNIFPRNFPTGHSTEVFSYESFLIAYRLVKTQHEREHVTNVFYKNSERFKICNLPAPNCAGDAKEMSFAIDTEDDIRRFKKILQLMVENHTRYTGSKLYGLYREINTND